MTSAANQAELEAEHSRPIYFLHLDLAVEALYACTGVRTYQFDGQDWLGIGEIQGISDLAEAADIAARNITITVSSVDANITEPLQSRTNYKGRAVAIYRGYLDANGDLVDDPEPRWMGRMDVGSMVWDDEYTAQMVCEPLTARLLRSNISRYSDEDHQLRHSGDKFFEFLPQIENLDVVWGGGRVSPSRGDISIPREGISIPK